MYERSRAMMRAIKKQGLESIHRVLGGTGAGELYSHSKGLRGAVILMYHSVAQPADAEWLDPRNHLPAEMFHEQMMFISSRRRPISMSELVESLAAGREPAAGTVVVTFDDGYMDTLTVAAPILDRLRIPATVYLPTAYTGRAEPQWIDRLYVVFKSRRERYLTWPAGGGKRYDLDRRAQRAEAYSAVAGDLLAADHPAREGVFARLGDQLRPERTAGGCTMGWDDVAALRRVHGGFEVGGHTRGHTDLTGVDPGTAEREVRGCADDIRQALGTSPAHFSFPYSRTDGSVVDLVRAAGFSSGAAEGGDCLVTAGADPHCLPRVEAPGSLARFRFYTSGAYPSLSRALIGRPKP